MADILDEDGGDIEDEDGSVITDMVGVEDPSPGTKPSSHKGFLLGVY